MEQTRYIFLNNNFVTEEKALLHISDLAFQRGYGVFDFFRLQGAKPLFLEEHLTRFYASAQAAHLPVPLSKEELTAAIFELIERNNQPNTGVRISFSGGYSADGFSIGKPNLLISQQTFTPPTQNQRRKGIRLLSHSYQRQLPHIKTIDYLMAIWLQSEIKSAGADDVLYHNAGIISECPRSNFFLVTRDNRLVTPAENILKGVTRKKVIELASAHLTVEERPVSLEEIKMAKQAFVTSTTKQILRVAQIDETIFTETDTVTALQNLFQKACAAET